jgi:hypothetical protein
VKPSAHTLVRRASTDSGIGSTHAHAASAASLHGVARGRVRKPPLAHALSLRRRVAHAAPVARVAAPAAARTLSAAERGLIVRTLRGAQNCALLYRKTGRNGFALRREGVRGGAGGAHMTWTSKAQPTLRAAAAAGAAAAAAAGAGGATAARGAGSSAAARARARVPTAAAAPRRASASATTTTTVPKGKRVSGTPRRRAAHTGTHAHTAAQYRCRITRALH